MASLIEKRIHVCHSCGDAFLGPKDALVEEFYDCENCGGEKTVGTLAMLVDLANDYKEVYEGHADSSILDKYSEEQEGDYL